MIGRRVPSATVTGAAGVVSTGAGFTAGRVSSSSISYAVAAPRSRREPSLFTVVFVSAFTVGSTVPFTNPFTLPFMNASVVPSWWVLS